MIIVAGLLVAFILVVLFSNRRTRNCRWRENRRDNQPGQYKFKCMTCGAEVFTSNGKPPLDCARNPSNRRGTP
ncbi:hypothetical protein ROA7450_02726 [Roseovarius albus]|uniref:Uncharacterized protein n=1 Tax=Roseovarius albus TaxID=1247867 RepID=A0A1X6ZJN0_9RHOB|nr:hypothetical protein ROA7450_02726 [Roseovarius albus]